MIVLPAVRSRLSHVLQKQAEVWHESVAVLGGTLVGVGVGGPARPAFRLQAEKSGRGRAARRSRPPLHEATTTKNFLFGVLARFSLVCPQKTARAQAQRNPGSMIYTRKHTAATL